MYLNVASKISKQFISKLLALLQGNRKRKDICGFFWRSVIGMACITQLFNIV